MATVEFRKEWNKFVETASVEQLERKQLELELLKSTVLDPDVKRDIVWCISQIVIERGLRPTGEYVRSEHVVLSSDDIDDQQ